MKNILKPVLIYLPLDLIEIVDQVSTASSVSRSEQVRRSLRRDTDFIMQHELDCEANHAKVIHSDYEAWRQANTAS